jgi:hypothetical protein
MRDFKTYNGWANYATWKVNLELFSDFELEEVFPDWEEMNMYQRIEALERYAKFFIYTSSTEGIARELAINFLEEVDWEETAKLMS